MHVFFFIEANQATKPLHSKDKSAVLGSRRILISLDFFPSPTVGAKWTPAPPLSLFHINQSLETTVGKDTVSDMEAHLGVDDLVVGAALTGHAFQGNETAVKLTGVTTPWNTLALWDVSKLAKLG